MGKCIQCGNSYRLKARNQKFCRKECWSEYHHEKYMKHSAGSRRMKEERKCEECGNRFVSRAWNQKFCGMKCANRFQQRKILNTHKQKRRFYVLHRDKFRCRYCGKKAKTAKLHVDHIVPVKEGGKDDYENMVTACRACNLGKGQTVYRDIHKWIE